MKTSCSLYVINAHTFLELIIKHGFEWRLTADPEKEDLNLRECKGLRTERVYFQTRTFQPSNFLALSEVSSVDEIITEHKGKMIVCRKKA